MKLRVLKDSIKEKEKESFSIRNILCQASDMGDLECSVLQVMTSNGTEERSVLFLRFPGDRFSAEFEVSLDREFFYSLTSSSSHDVINLPVHLSRSFVRFSTNDDAGVTK